MPKVIICIIKRVGDNVLDHIMDSAQWLQREFAQTWYKRSRDVISGQEQVQELLIQLWAGTLLH